MLSTDCQGTAINNHDLLTPRGRSDLDWLLPIKQLLLHNAAANRVKWLHGSTSTQPNIIQRENELAIQDFFWNLPKSGSVA